MTGTTVPNYFSIYVITTTIVKRYSCGLSMVGLYCAVSGCQNNLAKCRSLGLNVTFHRFPIDPSLREIWTESCNRGKDWKKQNVFMCSEHFTPSDFRSSATEAGQKRTHLVRGAVPSHNLPTSKFVCCADGCNNAPSEILVRRFPKDIASRTELLGDLPRKQGLSVMDCYLCNKHLALKQFLKAEVEKIGSTIETESDDATSDIVILEVSTVGGKLNSTKLIKPRAKKRKIRFQVDDATSATKHKRVDVLANTSRKVTEPLQCNAVCDETLKSEITSTHENKMHQQPLVNPNAGLEKSSPAPLASSSIGPGPLPVLVKNGDTSQLMFLHHSSDLHCGSPATSKPGTDLDSDISNVGKGSDDMAISENRPNSSSIQMINTKPTGDVLIDRLHRRIKELEGRIVSQRERYKQKMMILEKQYSNKVKELNSRVKELKSEVNSFNKLHKNIAKKGLVRPVIQSSPKPSQVISEEVQQILGRSFTSNQIKKIINESEPIRWTNFELLNAYTLKHLSYGAYTFVRNHLNYPLPSPKYLGRWLSRVEKDKIMSHPITGSDVQASESENESDEELPMINQVTGSAKSENSCREIILENPADTACGLDFEQENVEAEEIEEDELQESKEILIIAKPKDTSSSNIEISNQGHETENDVEVYYSLASSKDSLSSPEVYFLKQANEKTLEGNPIKDLSSCSENLGECELNYDDDDSYRLEQVLIVEEVDEENNSHRGEV